MSNLLSRLHNLASDFTSLPVISSLENHWKNEKVQKALFLTGLGLVSWKLCSHAFKAVSYFTTSEYNLLARYGQSSWVLITGGSDGIGKEFAVQFAKRGFNIVLVARNQEKLATVKNEITSLFPNVQVRIVVADFEKAAQEGFFERIAEEVKDLDISILINNVGVALMDEYHLIPLSKIREVVTVNCLSPALMTRVFLSKLAARIDGTKKSAIIDVCSMSAEYPRPYLQVYGATKTFGDYLMKGLQYEYPNMDILSLKCGFVATKMMMQGEKLGKYVSTADEVVAATIRYLGKTSSTNGHWKHQWQSFFLSSLPEARLKKIFKTNLGNFLKQLKAQQATNKQDS